jgi:hypothetical protein
MEIEMATFIVTTIILYVLFRMFGGNILFRLSFACVAGPFVGYAAFYSFSFFFWISGIVSEEQGHQLMTFNSLTHPVAIATVAYFFWGFLDPKLYGYR